MKRLRMERDNYFLWKSGQGELIRLSKVLTAFEYYAMKNENTEKMLDLKDTERNRDETKIEL